MDARQFLSIGAVERGDFVYHRKIGVAGFVHATRGRKITVHIHGRPELAVEWTVDNVAKLPQLVAPTVRLVGLAPAEADPGAPPLCGHSGIRLAAACGLDDWTLLGAVFDLRNALATPRSRETSSDRRQWTLRELREGAVDALRGAGEAVVLGKDIAEALGPSEPLHWLRPVKLYVEGKRRVAVTVVPHPSGRCRLWNDATKRREARRVLGAIARRSIGCPPGTNLSAWARAQSKARVLHRAGVDVSRALDAAGQAVLEAQWAARSLGAPRRG